MGSLASNRQFISLKGLIKIIFFANFKGGLYICIMRPLSCFLAVFFSFSALSFPYREAQRSFFKYEKRQKAFKNRQEKVLKARLEKIQGLKEQTDFQKQEDFFEYERKKERLEKRRRYRKKQESILRARLKKLKRFRKQMGSSPPFSLKF